MTNRIKKHIDDLEKSSDKCIISSANNKVTISYRGFVDYWEWRDDESGVFTTFGNKLFKLHPLASEVFVLSEIGAFIVINNVSINDVVFIDDMGRVVDELNFHPSVLGEKTESLDEKKQVLIYLYQAYSAAGALLTEDMVEIAKDFGVFDALVSLISTEE